MRAWHLLFTSTSGFLKYCLGELILWWFFVFVSWLFFPCELWIAGLLFWIWDCPLWYLIHLWQSCTPGLSNTHSLALCCGLHLCTGLNNDVPILLWCIRLCRGWNWWRADLKIQFLYPVPSLLMICGLLAFFPDTCDASLCAMQNRDRWKCVS